MPEQDEAELSVGITELLSSVLQLQLAERRIEGRVAADLGLSPSDVLALALLVRSQRQPIGQIAHDLDLTPGSASLLVTRLAKAGLVVRVRNEHDGRSVLIEATEEGVAAVRSVRDQYAAAVREAAASVTNQCLHTAALVVRQTAVHLGRNASEAVLASR